MPIARVQTAIEQSKGAELGMIAAKKDAWNRLTKLVWHPSDFPNFRKGIPGNQGPDSPTPKA